MCSKTEFKKWILSTAVIHKPIHGTTHCPITKIVCLFFWESLPQIYLAVLEEAHLGWSPPCSHIFTGYVTHIVSSPNEKEDLIPLTEQLEHTVKCKVCQMQTNVLLFFINLCNEYWHKESVWWISQQHPWNIYSSEDLWAVVYRPLPEKEGCLYAQQMNLEC
jgi:hypothetical protein